ncbi:MAG: class I SAM-dependent methyltransferase, partial [Prosthecobacter sp.]|nr:class I SAM-dependent methyltransferase [Prosthecobacter sp.]
MTPAETALAYDQLALWWQQNTPAAYGIAQLERAITFTSQRGAALDVGCGSQSRFIDVLAREGFQVEGLDISLEMIALAQDRSLQATFYTADICHWELLKKYDLITAWDSTFHLPLDQQEPVLRKLCDGLTAGGVLLFTCGGGSAGEITGTFEGQELGYSTLGVEAFVAILYECGCLCRHVEYDQSG